MLDEYLTLHFLAHTHRENYIKEKMGQGKTVEEVVEPKAEDLVYAMPAHLAKVRRPRLASSFDAMLKQQVLDQCGVFVLAVHQPFTSCIPLFLVLRLRPQTF